eukprot:12695831-Alexandrium_andersonii.AAC.1
MPQEGRRRPHRAGAGEKPRGVRAARDACAAERPGVLGGGRCATSGCAPEGEDHREEDAEEQQRLERLR